MSSQIATRCASCGARLRPDDEWCSLCLTNVNDTASATTDARTSGAASDASAPAGAATTHTLASGPGSLPRLGPTVAATTDRLLSELAALEAARERDSSFGVFRRRFGDLATRGGGAVLAAAAGAGLLVVVMAGLTLIGHLV